MPEPNIRQRGGVTILDLTRIRDLLRAAEIFDAFRIFAREEDAVASFG